MCSYLHYSKNYGGFSSLFSKKSRPAGLYHACFGSSALSQLNFGVGEFRGFKQAGGNKELPMQKRYIVCLTDEERNGALHSVSIWASEFGLSLGQVTCVKNRTKLRQFPSF